MVWIHGGARTGGAAMVPRLPVSATLLSRIAVDMGSPGRNARYVSMK
jgi:hypothetical protein